MNALQQKIVRASSDKFERPFLLSSFEIEICDLPGAYVKLAINCRDDSISDSIKLNINLPK